MTGGEKLPSCAVMAPEPEKKSLENDTPKNFDTNSPCPRCGSPLFWESIYRDGVIRCRQCEPPPARRFIGRTLAVVPDDRPGSSEFTRLADVTPTIRAWPKPPPETPPDGQESDASQSDDLDAIDPADPLAGGLLRAAWRYTWAPDRWADVNPVDRHTLAACTQCRSEKFEEVFIRPGCTRIDCERCGLTKGFIE
jgi:hypothetical protein